jgi:large subunit ribosomal protein L17
MRHKKKFNHLGRQRGHRRAMLSNMAASLILHKRITTTTAKAKALKIYIEPLITKAKDDSTHSRRHVFSYLQDKDAVSELFREIAVKVGDRPGGYTRIIKLGQRQGDAADMCIIELVDFNENMLAEKAAASKASRRRRGGKKKADGTETVAAAAPVAKEATKAETAVEQTEAAEVAETPVAEDVVDENKAEELVAEESAETGEKNEMPAAQADESPVAEKTDEEPEADEDAKKKEE